jgi:hypothetical protein
LRQSISVSVCACGWLLLALGGVLIAVSVGLEWEDRGNGGLFVGMLGGILTMRAYVFAAFEAGYRLGREDREEQWREAFDIGREVGQEHGGRVRPMR